MQNVKKECEQTTSFMAARAAEKARLADVEERRLKSRVMMVNGITARLIKKHAPPDEIYRAREGVNALWRLALKMERKRMEADGDAV